jgi:hypothetical protein
MRRGLPMPFDTEHGRSRTDLASVLRLLLVPVLLVLFHTEPASAVSPVVPLAAPPEGGALDAGVTSEAEPPICELADASLAVEPGSCAAPLPAVALPGVGVPSAEASAAKSPADPAPADRAAPMCDPNAMSITAPVDIPEVDRGRFEPLPCGAQALLSLLRSQQREGGIQLVAAREPSPRAPLHYPSPNDGNDAAAVSGAPCWPERAAPATLAALRQGGLAWRAGHRSRIDRPPSLRA